MKFTARTTEISPQQALAQNVHAVPHMKLNSQQAASRAATAQRSVAAALVVTACCLAITLAVCGSEPANSGWALSPPPTAFNAKRPTSPQMRIAINHVLEQGQVPLLQAPAQQRITPLDEEEDSPSADETQIESVDGWRPANLSGELTRPTNDSEPSTAERGPRFQPISSNSLSDEAPATETTSEMTNSAPAAKPDTLEQDTAATTAVNSDKHRATTVDSPSPASKTQPPPAKQDPVATQPLPPLSQNMKNLRAKVRRVLKSYYNRPLNSRDNDPWESMHGMLAYGIHSKIRQGSPQGKTITLVGWLCYNRPCKGMTLLYTTPENELRGKQGVGLQGHMGQFLAMLAQCQVSPEYPIRVRDSEFTIQDLIEAEQKTCYPKSELTFKLIALMHYLDSDATWVNDQGASWDIPRLIREELAQPIRGAACGGTHRLSGLSLAARTRVRRGEPLDGEYLRAAQFVEKYHNYAYHMQNRDGSMSTEWFRGRGEEADIDRRVKTTGHIIEWLCYSVSDKEVRSVRTFRAVNYLSSLLANNYSHEWEVGPLSHAIHALRLYDERVYQPYDIQDEVAKKSPRKTAGRPKSSSSRPTQQR